MAQQSEWVFSMTEDQYRLMRLEDGGYCLACGEPTYGIEGDCEEELCDVCDERQVYGLPQLMIMGRIEITE